MVAMIVVARFIGGKSKFTLVGGSWSVGRAPETYGSHRVCTCVYVTSAKNCYTSTTCILLWEDRSFNQADYIQGGKRQ